MANTFRSGTVYVDTTGSLIARRAKVAYILLTAVSAGDEVVLRDGVGATDPIKLHIKNASALDTKYLDFSNSPILFQDGIYCSILTAGAKVTLVLTSEGANT